MTALVAVVLAGMNTFLKPTHDKNEAVYNKRAILAAVNDYLPSPVTELSDEQVEEIFSKISQTVIKVDGTSVDKEGVIAAGYKEGTASSIDMGKERKKPENEKILPTYGFTGEDGKKYWIVSVRGKGLWDEIWGNIAFEDDLNTIAGVSFDHKAETPGLGAEIKDNKDFYSQFKGKKIYDGPELRSVYVRKGGAKDPDYEVDGISGATITADGVTEMMARGLSYYEPYFNSLKG